MARESSGRHVNAFDLQAKMQALRKMGADVETLHLAVVLMYRKSKDGWVHDRLETLADEAAIKYRTAQRSLRWLRDRGVIEDAHFTKPGGPRGSAWAWRRRVLPMTSWLKEEHAQQAPSSEEEHAQDSGRARLATRHISSPSERGEGRAPMVALPALLPRGNDDYLQVITLSSKLGKNPGFGWAKVTSLLEDHIGSSEPTRFTDDELQCARELLSRVVVPA